MQGFITRAQLARELEVTEKTVRRWERELRLPVHRLGNSRLYDLEEVRRWLRSRRRAA